MAQCHLDERACVEAEEQHALVRELKPLAAEEPRELHHARLAPRGLVVAGYDVVFLVERGYGTREEVERGVVAIVGEVARDEHEVDGGIGVDVGDDALEILTGLGVARIEMHVGDLGKRERLPVLRHRGRTAHKQQRCHEEA